MLFSSCSRDQLPKRLDTFEESFQSSQTFIFNEVALVIGGKGEEAKKEVVSSLHHKKLDLNFYIQIYYQEYTIEAIPKFLKLNSGRGRFEKEKNRTSSHGSLAVMFYLAKVLLFIE